LHPEKHLRLSRMTRDHIVAQIRQIAEGSGGDPPGKMRFAELTGISESDWSGRYWARWSDALREAGFEPNIMQGAYEEPEVLDKLISLIEELRHFPTVAELQLRRRSDPTFPSAGVFARLGKKGHLAAKVLRRCEEVGNRQAAAAICTPIAEANGAEASTSNMSPDCVGSVYLIRSGRNYKIGRTNAVGRREYELGIQMPDPIEVIHVIRTDDPVGVEAYWHRRFADRRKQGEWFDLRRSDVAAFNRWKSIS
jgi:hypothetical protein